MASRDYAGVYHELGRSLDAVWHRMSAGAGIPTLERAAGQHNWNEYIWIKVDRHTNTIPQVPCLKIPGLHFTLLRVYKSVVLRFPRQSCGLMSSQSNKDGDSHAQALILIT